MMIAAHTAYLDDDDDDCIVHGNRTMTFIITTYGGNTAGGNVRGGRVQAHIPGNQAYSWHVFFWGCDGGRVEGRWERVAAAGKTLLGGPRHH